MRFLTHDDGRPLLYASGYQGDSALASFS